jgi:hypothetical protein
MDFVLRMQDAFARASAPRSASRNGCLIAQPRQGPAEDRLRAPRTESAHEIDDKAYHQNQTNPAAADSRAPKVKPAPTEQQKKNKQNNY